MEAYKHTQFGYAIAVSLGIAILFCIVLALVIPRSNIMIPIILILAFTLYLFSSLTIEVNTNLVKLKFGPGLIKTAFRLDEISHCQIVTNPWYYGYGIHLFISSGWIYNVSGNQAVELVMKNGKKYRLGTDEPETLYQAILARLETSEENI